MQTALVVDDSKVVRKFVSRTLKSLGFEVTEAENGDEALRACSRSMPELLVVDWHMPVMDGLELLKELRGRPDGPQPKIVFCTTENSLSNIATIIESGADEYIMKPFDREILRLKLASIGALDHTQE